MIQPVRLLVFAVSLAASAAIVGFWQAGWWLGVALSVGWFAFWVTNVLRQVAEQAGPRSSDRLAVVTPVGLKAGSGSWALFFYALLVIYAVGQGVWPGWMIVGLVASLAGWDLEYFIHRLRDVRDPDMVADMIKSHLRRLGLVLGVGLLVTGAVLAVHYRLTFGMAIVVTLLAVVGLTRFIGLVKHIQN